jgi:hypothetical protein
MKVFIIVLISAAILGGFVGGELSDKTFSATGFAVGLIGTAVILLGLGAFFTSREEAKKKADLPPEIRGVFDRMFGDTPSTSRPPITASPSRPPQLPTVANDDSKEFIKLVNTLIGLQILPKYARPHDAFGSIMTNKRAAGYLFGFHDAFLQRIMNVNQSNKNMSIKLVEMSYKNMFGEQAGYILFDRSLHWQDDPIFLEGRMMGGNDLVEYSDNKTPALGLGRILILEASE